MPATLSLSTEVFAAEQIEVALDWAQRLGLDAVEVGVTHAAALAASAAVRAAARDAACRFAIRLASLHAWTQVDGLDQVCPVVGDLGAGLVVVHCPDERLAADFNSAAAILTRWQAWCRDRRITLTVENSSRQQLEPLAALFAAVPALALTLDVKHAYKPRLFGRTHVDYMRQLGPRVANFHLVGIDPARDDLLGDGIPAGNDPVDYAALAAELAGQSYAGLLTVESAVPDLPPGQLERAYADIPAASPPETSVARRLSRHNVRYFAERFAAATGRAKD